MSSIAHRDGKKGFDDLNFPKRDFVPWAACGQSKHANLLLTFELQHRLHIEGLNVTAVAAHPGWTGTNLQRHR